MAEGNYVTESEPDKPYRKYKLADNKVLVVSETEDFAYFGEDLGDLGIKPGSKFVKYKEKEFVLSTSDFQILKSVELGNPEGNVEFWDYENGNEIISIGILAETGERSDVVGKVIEKGEISFSLDSGSLQRRAGETRNDKV